MCIYDLLIFAVPLMILFSKKIRELIQKKSALFIVLSFTLLGLHGWARGYKWQFIPLYAFNIIFVTNILLNRKKEIQADRGIIDKWTLACLILTLVLGWAFPPSENFRTTGTYEVGSEIMTMSMRETSDTAWPNVFESFQKQNGNKLVIHLTFPLGSENEAPYPVVIGYYGQSESEHHYTDFEKELASQGFVVIQIRDIQNNSENAFGKRFTYSKKIEVQGVPTESFSMDAGHVRHIVDQLEQINQNKKSGQLAGLLDLDRIAFIGEASSCVAVGEVARKDDRIKAIIALDTFPDHLMLETFLKSLTVSYLQFQYANGIESSERTLFESEGGISGADKWLVNLKLNKFGIGKACLRTKEHGAKVKLISMFCRCYLLGEEPRQALLDIIATYSEVTGSCSYTP